MKNNKIRLNPFVYISETDVRFYLLVFTGIIIPSFWALTFGIILFLVMAAAEISLLLRLLISISVFSFIPFLIYWDYKTSIKKIVNKSKLKKFNREKYPAHHEYIEKLYREHLSAEKKPTIMVQPLDPSKSAFTFGTKNHIFIGIPGGLIKMFRENINGFKSIFLHEMGHIVNRDVEKTYLANSTWRSLFLTLSIPFGIFLLYDIYVKLSMFYYGILAGYDLDYIINTTFVKSLLMSGGLTIYLLIFLGIIYVLRKQIIQLREFYADAKVLEWEESPEEIIKILEESGGVQYSKFELLRKFHPNISERIQVLKNNSRLFIPSLWAAFTIGFFYGIIELSLSSLKTFIFSISSSEWIAMGSGEYQPIGELNIAFRAFISIFIFTILMLAISSSFHKSILKDVFIDNVRYFSTATLLNAMKFSLVFSLGWLTNYIISFPQYVSLYETNILIGDFLDIAKAWIFHAIYFSIALVFLLIFASMLIQRSFSKKEAERNFLMVTVFSSILYIIIRFGAIEILHNKPLIIVIFLIFSVVAYTFIRMKDKRLCCPGCNKKIDFLVLRLRCPNCQLNLYPWAIYSFS